jgi:hypothetical protein
VIQLIEHYALTEQHAEAQEFLMIQHAPANAHAQIVIILFRMENALM